MTKSKKPTSQMKKPTPKTTTKSKSTKSTTKSKTSKSTKSTTTNLQVSSRESVWAGPESVEEDGGITFSLLSRFLSCRERFRLLVVEGLKVQEGFNHRLEYGNMWHLCEECHANNDDWKLKLLWYCTDLCKQHPLAQEEIDKWYNVCKVQFPIYLEYWKNNQDVKNCVNLLPEQTFAVPYKLPSGRTVILRGKWDSVDLLGKGKTAGIWLFEHKTKGEVKEDQLKRQLTFDLQTMLYLVALAEYQKISDNGAKSLKWSDGHHKIQGVRYNVIRRPLSGGKGTIRQHQPTKNNPQGESKLEYYQRLSDIILETPQEYFFRWNVQVRPDDITKFRRQCLDPLLEQLCDWWDWVIDKPRSMLERAGRTQIAPHWRHPYGVFNPIDEGMVGDLDHYLDSGNEVGLQRVSNLFPELTNSEKE